MTNSGDCRQITVAETRLHGLCLIDLGHEGFSDMVFTDISQDAIQKDTDVDKILTTGRTISRFCQHLDIKKNTQTLITHVYRYGRRF